MTTGTTTAPSTWTNGSPGPIPRISASRFHAWMATGESGDLTIRWTAVAGKTYRIISSSGLDSGWQEVAGDLPAVVPESSFPVNPAGIPRRFFRVEVNP